MATWSKRIFAAGPHQVSQWAAVQDAFLTHYKREMSRFMSRYMREASRRDSGDNRPKISGEDRPKMMLVMWQRRGGEVTLCMALPDGISRYDGFEPAEFSDIPLPPSFLAGDEIGYDELFVVEM
jgi:hypothetical protein